MHGVWTITYDSGSGPVEQSMAAWGLTAKPVIRTRDRAPTSFSFRMAGAAPEGSIPFPFKAKVTIKQNRTFSGGSWSGSGFVWVGYQTTQPSDVDRKSQGVNLVFKDAIWLMENTVFQQLWAQPVAARGGGFVVGQTYTILFVGTTDFTAIGAASNTVGVAFVATGVGSGSGIAQFDIPVSRCILFMDINSYVPNTIQSVQWQIQQIIAYAAACGIGIAAGTIDYSGWYINYYHCRAMSCWDALLKCLEPIADAKVWVDGSTSTPTLNVRTRANIAAMSTPTGTGPGPITLPYKGTDSSGRKHFSTKCFTPRYDLVPPQVVLQYQINNTVNGKPAPRWQVRSYPSVVSGSSNGQLPFALVVPIDLTGVTSTTETGTLDCEPLACVGGTHAAKRAWWASKRGGEQHKLADFRLRFGSNTLPDATYYDESGAVVAQDAYGNPIIAGVSYPCRLVKGTYHAWMAYGGTPIVAARLRVSVQARFSEWDAVGSTPAETDTNGNPVKKCNTHDLHFEITVTNAPGGVTPFECTTNNYTSSESPVTGLETSIYNSRSTLDYDGEHEIIDPGLPNGSSPTGPLQQLIGHWNVLNFSGGVSAWATANMTVSGTETDLMTNHIRIEVGPSKHLQPQDWNAMLQFWRQRRVFMLPDVRGTGYGDAAGNVDMALNTPDANTVPGLAVHSFQSVIAADSVDATRTNVIKQDATGTQLQVVQQKTSDNSVYTSGVIAPEYSGSGAPSATTLVTNAYYRAGDKYVDTATSALYRCTTAGDKASSVWARLGGGSNVWL